MHCINPITISNKKLAFHAGYDRLKVVVPCGSCECCRENIKNDWILRTYYHWLQFYDSGGKVLFVTLSYCNDALPIHHDGNFHFACFSRKDVMRWLNSIRKFLEVHFGIVGIDYIVTCEYGGKNTHRPHYHALLFFPNHSNLPRVPYLKEIIEYYWTGVQWRKDKKGRWRKWQLIRKSRGRCPRRKGFVYWSKKFGAEVTCAKAAKYVGKYICKDLDFYNKPDIKKYLSFDGNKDKLKGKLPCHWQSHSFGLSLLDYILSLPYDKQLECLENGVAFKSQTYRYSIPSYITNKLYYYANPMKLNLNGTEHSIRVFTDRWFRFNLDLQKRKLDNVCNDLKLKLSPAGLEKYLPTLDYVERWCRSFDLPFLDYYSLSDYLVNNYIKPFSFDDLVAYKCVYRGYSYNDVLYNVPWCTVEGLTKLAPSIILDRLKFNYSSYDVDLDGSERSFANENSINKYVLHYNIFERLLCLLESLECFSSERKIMRIRNDEDKINVIRNDMFKYEDE